MKSILATLLVCAAFSEAAGQAVFSIEENFDNGMPQTFTILERDATTIDQKYYKNVKFDKAWFTTYTDNSANQAALSLSHTGSIDNGAQENWLITPQVRVLSNEVCLRWDAKSIFNNLFETYKVMISTTDTEIESFTELITIEEETYDWTTHIIPLKEYKGKDIYIAFVNQSNNKFILAIDNLTIGMIPDVKFVAETDLKVFYNNEDEAKGTLRITNIGKRATIKEFALSYAADGNEIETSTIDISKELAPSEVIEVEIEIPSDQNEVTSYTITAITDDDNGYTLIEDNIVRSYFERKYLVEKMTAMWCNNCPNGDIYLYPAKKRLKDEMIYINSHCTDQLAESYWTGLQRWIMNMPGIIVNRDKDYVNQSMTGADKYDILRESIYEPTYAKVTATAKLDVADKSKVNIDAEVEFAKEYDNSNDYYRIGYAIFNKEFSENRNAFKQSNSATLPASREYYFLPADIPAEIMTYYHVPILEATAFTGEANSFPSQINVGDKVSHSTQLTIPEDYVGEDDLYVVAFAMNSRSGSVLNAYQVDITDPAGIERINSNTGTNIKLSVNNNICNINFEDESTPFCAEIISVDGRVLSKIIDYPSGNNTQINLADFTSGFAIIKVSQGNYSTTKKIIVK